METTRRELTNGAFSRITRSKRRLIDALNLMKEIDDRLVDVGLELTAPELRDIRSACLEAIELIERVVRPPHHKSR